MKYLTILMLMLLLNVSASIINTINQSDPLFYYTFQPYDEGYEEFKKEKAQQEEYFQSDATTDTTQLTFGDYLFAFFLFIGKVSWGIVWIPYTIKGLLVGINQSIANQIAIFISVPVYFVYTIGIIQFISNRSTKSMY